MRTQYSIDILVKNYLGKYKYMSKLKKIFNGLEQKIKAEYAEITSIINHSPTKGVSREKILKDFLLKYVPDNIGITSGEIISTDGQTSNQIDLIFYDKNKCPVFYTDGESSILPIEGVYGIVEVKSKLNENELIDAYNKINRVKKMPKTAYQKDIKLKGIGSKLYNKTWADYYPLFGFIIAFDSKDLVKLKNKLKEIQSKEELEYRTDSLWVFNKGKILNFNRLTGKFDTLPSKDTVLAALSSENDLILLLSQFHGLLSRGWMHYFDIWAYVDKDMDIGRFLHNMQ